MKGSRAWCAVAVLCLAACAERPSYESARAAPAERSCKPEAPVVVELTTRAVTATPTADVAELELAVVIDGVEHTAQRFGVTAAGQARTMTFALTGAKRLAGVARVPVDGVTLARTALLELEPAPPPRTKRYALDDGDRAEEIRP